MYDPNSLAHDVARLLADMLTGNLMDGRVDIELTSDGPDIAIVQSESPGALLQALTLIYASNNLIAIYVDMSTAYIARRDYIAASRN